MTKHDVTKKTIESKRQPYFKPQIEIVPLLPKQTVLGAKCLSSSLTTASDFDPCSVLTNACAQ